ncbi:thioredoxin family protein [Flavihumibacter solisilvae]|uniref:Thiol-disulfide isomerase n=1 Tax=Flavihumibacter solisilvae TaxID=1349421 RepID=A0A0C1KTP6_9BACT|nr:thioredoxin family protein [Flavihumibacter solisilvae]KIC90771.1 thiol-disulfide isomerase [Flavihumibacter solisilvae]
MKHFLFALLCTTGMSVTGWQTNFETAKKLAKEQDKLILLNFSGSDWCGPCIRMHREFFSNDQFTRMADSALIMLNADFPRDKKHQLSKEQKAHNEALADQYNPSGKFPFTLLLDAEGKVIRSWDGFPSMSPAGFSMEIKHLYESRNKQKNDPL